MACRSAQFMKILFLKYSEVICENFTSQKSPSIHDSKQGELTRLHKINSELLLA